MEGGLEGGDISIEHFLRDQAAGVGAPDSTGLRHLFDGATVLLTGASGHIGSLVLEKILRSCENVSKVYVPMRGKHGKTAVQRLNDLIASKLFDRVKMEHRESLDKVDLVDLDLGMGRLSTALASANMVIHCALVADGRHSLSEAVAANLNYTRVLLDAAQSAHDLEAFVVVSSTVCHGVERVVDERFYPPPVTAEAMKTICESLSESFYNNSTQGLLVADTTASGVTLTIAEDLIRTVRGALPLAIVRPSMLIASYKEPLAGWTPSEPRGLMGLLTLAMRGRLCALRTDADLRAELVPADLAANLVLAVTAHTADTRRNWKNKEVEPDPDPDTGGSRIIADSDIPIFNLDSSSQNPLSWREFFVCSLRHARTVPFLDTAWYPHLILTKSKFWFNIWFFLLHLLPAWVIDSSHTFFENPNILNAKRSQLYRKYGRVRDSCEAIGYHTLGSRKVRDRNARALWRSLGAGDRAVFDFDFGRLDWDEYLHTLARGARLYAAGDAVDSLPRAARRLNRLKLLHYSCVVMASFLIIIVAQAIVKVIIF